MNIYIAGRTDRRFEIRDNLKLFKKEKHDIVSRWIHRERTLNSSVPSDKVQFSLMAAREDLEDVRKADALLFLAETKGVGYNKGGRHVELGVAIERGLIIVILGPTENVFTYGWPQVETWKDAVEALEQLREDRLKGW